MTRRVISLLSALPSTSRIWTSGLSLFIRVADQRTKSVKLFIINIVLRSFDRIVWLAYFCFYLKFISCDRNTFYSDTQSGLITLWLVITWQVKILIFHSIETCLIVFSSATRRELQKRYYCFKKVINFFNRKTAVTAKSYNIDFKWIHA